jgi:hypothetical protein
MSSTKSHTISRFDKWWKDVGLRRLIGWQITVLISQMTTGYDESVVGSLQSMQPWVDGCFPCSLLLLLARSLIEC